MIDLVSFFHWHPKWPSETPAPKPDLQIKGSGLPSLWKGSPATDVIPTARDQKQQIQSFCLHELFSFSGEPVHVHLDPPPAQMKKVMALNWDSEWTGRSEPCHAPTKLWYPKRFWHHPVLHDGEICKTGAYQHLDIDINTDGLGYRCRYLDIWLSVTASILDIITDTDLDIRISYLLVDRHISIYLSSTIWISI